MNTSRVFNDAHGCNAAIVHMLMNKQNVVIISKESPQSRRLIDHFKQLKMTPKIMNIDDHDALMARTQAPLALLLETLSSFLNTQEKRGMLTTSADALNEVLKSRKLAWTDETINSILANPQLDQLIKQMQAILRSKV